MPAQRDLRRDYVATEPRSNRRAPDARSPGLHVHRARELGRTTIVHETSRRSAMASSLKDSAPWTGWLLAAMAATLLLLGIDLVLHPVSPGASELFEKFASGWIFIGAAALCVMKGRTSREEHSAWWLLAVAMALYAAGQVYLNVVVATSPDASYPSLADGFWLAFYLPAYAALYLLLRRRAGSFGRGTWLDILVGGLGVGGAAVALVFQSVLHSTDGTAAATAVAMAYPVGDVGLLALVVAAITVIGWKTSGVWHWIAPAFALFVAVDSIYLIQTAHGAYAVGGILDLGWPAAAVVVGLAAWWPESRVRPSVRAARTTVVVPAIFGFAALALLVADHFNRMNPVALSFATASIVVMLVRLYLAVTDNTRLLALSRREATTDALTGLGNRRQLTADLAAHLDDFDSGRPLMLTLFDLDGFKAYNDTFGHPAGDRLLVRLSARLSGVLADRGTAYRMGGDEFCALWHLSDLGQASVKTIDAVGALSEHGEAFSIGCSYGSALLPNEATEPTEALRLADRRMYTRKRNGRSSAGHQISDVLKQALAERSSELGTHLGDVAELASATAKQLGVPEEAMGALRQTALLHDVGKVAIPLQILNKPGPLDAAEWAFMKRHTVIGERIVSAAPALRAVAKLVRSTHEHYDGGGYPDGLAGHDIPLIARIVIVCDAYDAMVTDRPYKEAFSRSEAITELRHCSGTQFDPQVVEALVRALQALDDRSLPETLAQEPRPRSPLVESGSVASRSARVGTRALP
jgi:two-component system, cell cycle response regulator